ncbi:hypothetical protein [Picosynechococcus sp. PCC 73109]|uniref:hypothetical protein n=1 Tax=Picosynechococcus sp. PCC 73109 TaxID=374982 RepID=UPI0007458D62|nr:hypothetical protein [Picosynechococcus sp. PCC 73109]AMA07853.1 hypothetical protein AWQ23_00145 [Picosynechococcus sp. PCC 73109]
MTKIKSKILKSIFIIKMKNVFLCTLFGCFLLLQSCTSEPVNEQEVSTSTSNTASDQENNTLSISDKATSLSLGMTYEEVLELLGGQPDTVLNDDIRQEIGEPVQGFDLITFNWRNDKPNCSYISVDFDLIEKTVTGWNDGSFCMDDATLILTEPIGKSCSETNLCEQPFQE